jgi:hypothetical protein
MPPVAQRRTCLLCGRLFAFIMPRDERNRPKLCGECASLPEPPEEPTIGGDDAEPQSSSDREDDPGEDDCSGV